MGCCDPVGAHPTWLTPSQPVRSAPACLSVRGRTEPGERGRRPRACAPTWGESWTAGYPSGGIEGQADGVHAPEGSRPGRVTARVEDPTGVCERGMEPEGERGNVGEPPVSWSYPRPGGPGDHRPWRDLERPPGPEPCGDTTHHGSTPGSGEASDKRSPRDGEVAVVAVQRTGEGGGSEAQATHGREGAVGQRLRWRDTGERRRAHQPWLRKAEGLHEGSSSSAWGTGGVHCARPGLWGGRVGNHLLYPASDCR